MSKEINCAGTCSLCEARFEAWNYDGLLWLLDNHTCPARPPKRRVAGQLAKGGNVDDGSLKIAPSNK